MNLKLKVSSDLANAVRAYFVARANLQDAYMNVNLGYAAPSSEEIAYGFVEEAETAMQTALQVYDKVWGIKS